MRISTSSHTLSLREDYATPNLNIQILCEFLKSSRQGTKRARSSPVPTRRKRARTEAEEHADEDGVVDVDPEDGSKVLRVQGHVYELRYQRGRWNSSSLDEARLVKLLAEHTTPNRRVVDLGSLSVTVVAEQREIVLRASFPESASDYLIQFPHVHNDPVVPYGVLHGAGRAALSAYASVEWLQNEEGVNPSLVPILMRVQVEAGLLYPAISQPVPSSFKQAYAREVEEAQQRVLRQVFPRVNSLSPVIRARIPDISYLYSILQPAPALPAGYEKFTQPKGLLPTLLPFQRRSVAWLLGRENKSLTDRGAVVDKTSLLDTNAQILPPFWEEVRAPDKQESWYVDRFHGFVTPHKPEDDVLGGILAEEPGLGKTLECIALILLNPSIGRAPSIKRWDEETKVFVKQIKTTLIVTPPSLAPQWVDELALHAPSLKVLIYDGWSRVTVPITEEDVVRVREAKKEKRSVKRPSGKIVRGRGRGSSQAGGFKGRRSTTVDVPAEEIDEEKDGLLDWCAYVNTFDVCITTYNVLQHDLTVARPPPVRPRRATAQYKDEERYRSPLVLCEWYRVIMDEVQMVGGGRAEEMVSLIPRLSSFAVSGTPAKGQVADLIHVFKFLRVNSVATPRVWARLLQPGHIHEFTSLFRHYSIRTIKALVKGELTIPQQTRFLVPIELGPIERHVYNQTLDSALIHLGLDRQGVARRPGWVLDTAAMRAWLRKLRGICTHPQVGQLSQGDRLHKPGVLKSIGEVLEGMREQNWRTLMENRRNKIQLSTTLAQLQQREETDANRYGRALETLSATEKEARQLTNEVEALLSEHIKSGRTLKANTSENMLAPHGKGKARADSELSELIDSEDGDGHQNGAKEAYLTKKNALQLRLRECRIILHRVLFLKGDVYHMLGELHSAAEDDAYGEAEELRRTILRGTEDAAARAMDQLIRDDEKVQALCEADLMVQAPSFGEGSSRTAELMQEAKKMIQGLLNEQSALLWRWRERLIELLTQPLSQTSGDADGQEYTRTLETQGEAEVYLQAYAALFADRRESLTSERTILAAHDARETRARNTKAAQRAEAIMVENDEDDWVPLERIDNENQLPEHEVLQKTLNDERKALLEEFDPNRALKTIMIELNNAGARIRRKDDPEKDIIREVVAQLRTLISEQGNLVERLQSDLAHFRKAFNERISYFRQLQEISDTVAEAEWEGRVEDATAQNVAEQAVLENDIATARTRQRYLDHLAKSDGKQGEDEEEDCCVLCRCEFTRGFITQCAHVFCETCLKAWLTRREGKVCPICRVPIDIDQLQRFSLAKKPEAPQPPSPAFDASETVPQSRSQIEYSVISPELFQDIENMESAGSFGTKIDTLVRHLLFLQISDPGSKSIIFSAWADSLTIIQMALARNGIKCLRIDQKIGKQNVANKFKTEPEISVLLLHGERENAGLNVTCASRVFLLESVVHHAFELQAIARIDRMGQTRPTEVYCYYAENTVERNILDLASRQGQSLYTKHDSAGTLNVTRFAMTGKADIDAPAAKKKTQKGDFVFKTDDMLAIFFPHLYEDVEHSLPEDSEAGIQAAVGQDVLRCRSSQQTLNADAGPSRLAR